MAKKLKRLEIDRGGNKPKLHVLIIQCSCFAEIRLWDKEVNTCERCGTKYSGIGEEINVKK